MKILTIALLLVTITKIQLVNQSQLKSLVSSDKNQHIRLPEQGFRGYIPVDMGNYYYWGFYAHKNHETAPLFFWLTEGPGVSIFLPIFWGNGPYSIDEDTNINPNIYAWNKQVNIVFIDCPLGTGLSRAFKKYQKTPISMYREAQQLTQFTQKFFVKHSEFAGRDLIFGGESWGTEMVPALVYNILLNKKLPDNKIVGVFNSSEGIDIKTQYEGLPKQMLAEKRITPKRYNQIKPIIKIWDLGFKLKKGLRKPFALWPYIRKFILKRRKSAYPALIAGTEVQASYFNSDRWSHNGIEFILSPAMQAFYPMKKWNTDWLPYDARVQHRYDNFQLNDDNNFIPRVEYIMNYGGKGIPWCDMVSNTDGYFGQKVTLKIFEDLKWPGKAGFRKAKFRSIGDQKFLKQYGNLSFVILKKSTHELEFTNRRDTYKILERFLYDYGILEGKPNDLSSEKKTE